MYYLVDKLDEWEAYNEEYYEFSKDDCYYYDNKGAIEHTKNNCEKAIEFYSRSLSIKRKPFCLEQIGVCYWDMGRYDKAEEFLNETIKELDQLPQEEKENVIRIITKIVSMYRECNNVEKFDEYKNKLHKKYAQRVNEGDKSYLEKLRNEFRHESIDYYRFLSDNTNGKDQIDKEKQTIFDRYKCVRNYDRKVRNSKKTLDMCPLCLSSDVDGISVECQHWYCLECYPKVLNTACAICGD